MKVRLIWLAALLASLTTARAADTWTLERALDYALTHNPDARMAQQRIAAAQAGVEQANSAFWPRLQLQSGYVRTDYPMTVFGSILNQRSYNPALNFNNVPDVDNVNARGVVTLPLYAGGRNLASRQAAKLNRKVSQEDREAIRNVLGFEVVRAFHTVLKTRQFVLAATTAVESFEGNLTIAKRRLDGGTLLKSELLDVEVRLAQAREDLVRARNSRSIAVHALRNLLGIEAGEFEVAATAPAVAAPEVGRAVQRPEWAAAQGRELAAQAQVRANRSGYLPRVNAFGSLDYDYGTVTGGDGKSYTFGLMAQWDLWDGLATRSKLGESRANLEIAREEARKVRLAVDFEVEQARLNLGSANERLLVTAKVIEQAAESAGLTRQRFEQGLALAVQINDTESALVVARVRRAEAEADQRIAVAALRKALALPQLDGPAITK